MVINTLITVLILCIVSFGVLVYRFKLKPPFTIVGTIKPGHAPLILFDFDGVICDSYEAMIHAFNKVATKHGLNTLTKDPKFYKNLSTRAFLREAGVRTLKMPFIIKSVRNEIKYDRLQPFPEVLALIKALKSQGYAMGVVSSNTLENVQYFFNKYEIEGFDFIITGVGVYAKDKTIEKILTASALSPEEGFYLGDETRDIEACKKHNVNSVAVTWGFQSYDILQSRNPTFIIQKPDELMALLPHAKKQ